MATEIPVVQDIRKNFEHAGFTVAEAATPPGSLEVRKGGFIAYIVVGASGWIRFGPPYLELRGVQCELEDRGYQKFWYSKSDGKRFPIRKVDLENLHRFDEEVRYLLGTKSLYNESLGTTNARTVYDRLTGRPNR